MSEQKFYVHDTTRGFVGNSMVWWRKDHRGYTTNLADAHEFTEAELAGMADDLVAYPVDEVRRVAEAHVTARHVLEPVARKLGGGS